MGDPSASNEAGDPAGRHDDARQRLAEFYDACAEGLFRYAAMLLADPSAAEDAVHQAFAKLVAMGERLEKVEAVTAYLRLAVRNECYRLVKRRSRRRQVEHVPALLQAAADDEPEDDEALRHALEQAMGSLSAEQREVVHMKVYEKMTFQQIAERLAISINTAASRYRYALQRLRELLRPHMEERE